MVEPWGSLASLILFVLMCRGLWETSPEHSQTYSASDLCLLEHTLTLPWVSPPLHRQAPPCWSWRSLLRSWLSVGVSFDEATCGQTLVHRQENPQPVGGVGVSSGTRVDAESQVICAGLGDCTSARVRHSLDSGSLAPVEPASRSRPQAHRLVPVDVPPEPAGWASCGGSAPGGRTEPLPSPSRQACSLQTFRVSASL